MSQTPTHPPIPPNCDYFETGQWGDDDPTSWIFCMECEDDERIIINVDDVPRVYRTIIAAVACFYWRREMERIEREDLDCDCGAAYYAARDAERAWREWNQ